jgi:hypothetical protein
MRSGRPVAIQHTRAGSSIDNSIVVVHRSLQTTHAADERGDVSVGCGSCEGQAMRRVATVLARVVMVAVLAGCSAVPRVELTAYTTAYAEILTITNGILDIVVPYERIVIRTAGRTSALPDLPATGRNAGARN